MGRRGVSLVVAVAAITGALVPTAFAAPYTFESSTDSVTDNSQSRHALSCPAGGVAINGGVISSGHYADGTYVSESTPGTTGGGPAQGWTGQIDNYVGGLAQNFFTVTVTCAKNAKGDYARLVKENGVKVPDDSLGGATLKCKPGQAVVGGGNDTSFNAALKDETYLSMSAPVDGKDPDKVPDDGWRVEINNDEDGDQLVTKSNLYAICDKKHGASAYRYRTQAGDIPEGAQGSIDTVCRKGETLIGGGVEARAPYEASMLINSTSRTVVADRPRWSGYVDNYATPDGKARKLVVTAICKR